MGLNASVLVLNRLWQVVNVVNARRAITLLYVGRGKVVTDDFATYTWETWAAASYTRPGKTMDCVTTPSCRVVVPRIIQLLEYDCVPRPRAKFTRANVYLRDRNQCQYCGRVTRQAQLTLDHVHPRSRGGRTTWRNIVVSCFRCNALKANRRPEEAGMQLLREPRQPAWHPTTTLLPTTALHDEWIPFLEWGGTDPSK